MHVFFKFRFLTGRKQKIHSILTLGAFVRKFLLTTFVSNITYSRSIIPNWKRKWFVVPSADVTTVCKGLKFPKSAPHFRFRNFTNATVPMNPPDASYIYNSQKILLTPNETVECQNMTSELKYHIQQLSNTRKWDECIIGRTSHGNQNLESALKHTFLIILLPFL